MAITREYVKHYHTIIDHTISLQWYEDICNDDAVDRVLGNILQSSFASSMICETSLPINVTSNQSDASDLNHRTTNESKQPHHVRIYNLGTDIYIGIYDSPSQVSEATLHSHSKAHGDGHESLDSVCMRLLHTSSGEISRISNPTGVELREGLMENYQELISVSRRDELHKWIDVVLRWIRIDEFEGMKNVSISRNRYLLSSRLGYLNGYNVRIELFEDRNLEMIVLVHGLLPDHQAMSCRIDQELIQKLTLIADSKEEKSKFETLDTYGVAQACCDRLTLKPTKRWIDFLSKADLLSHRIERKYELFIRLSHGPGRYVGSTMTNIYGIDVVISLFEMTNDLDVYCLRILVYEIMSASMIEYRLSPLERILLFNLDHDLISQIIDRIRPSYGPLLGSQGLLALPKDYSFQASFDGHYDAGIYGDHEYRIVYDDIDDEKVVIEESLVKGLVDIKDQSAEYDTLIMNALIGSHYLPIDYKTNALQSRHNSQVSPHLENSIKGWALKFDRSLISHYEGNLTISVCLNSSYKGFFIYILDIQTLHEYCKYLSYNDSCDLMYSTWTMKSLQELVARLKEETLMTLMQNILSSIEIVPERHDNASIVLKKRVDAANNRDIVIAKVKYVTNETAIARKRPRFCQHVAIKVVKLSNIALTSMNETDQDDYDSKKSEGVDIEEPKRRYEIYNSIVAYMAFSIETLLITRFYFYHTVHLNSCHVDDTPSSVYIFLVLLVDISLCCCDSMIKRSVLFPLVMTLQVSVPPIMTISSNARCRIIYPANFASWRYLSSYRMILYWISLRIIRALDS